MLHLLAASVVKLCTLAAVAFQSQLHTDAVTAVQSKYSRQTK